MKNTFKNRCSTSIFFKLVMMRLDKFFSELKIFSRREIAPILKKGLISVNGKIVKKADFKINELADEIKYNGEIVKYRPFIYLMLNKPEGYISATEDLTQKTVLDLIPENLRKFNLFPVGRLDKDTTGLVILTNDGMSAHRALSPKHHVEKKYLFKTADSFDENDINTIENGVTLNDGYTTKPCKIERISENEGFITLTEGKYHEIKRLFGSVGNKIISLKRVSFSEILLGDLPLGEWRHLSEEEEKIFTIIK